MTYLHVSVTQLFFFKVEKRKNAITYLTEKDEELEGGKRTSTHVPCCFFKRGGGGGVFL